MSFTNLLLAGNWDFDEWPEHVDVSHEGKLDYKRYEPRRICRMEYDPVHRDYVCSACGERFNTHGYVRVSRGGDIELAPYRCCPNCGAKAVGE